MAYFRLRVMEATPSARYNSGFAYNHMTTADPLVPTGSQTMTELCMPVPHKDMPRGSPVFQNEIYDDSISFQLSSQLLSTGGRRSQFLERIRRQTEFLKKNVQPEGFLRTGSSRMAATMSEFDKAMAGLQRPATDCLDADTFVFWLNRAGGPSPHNKPGRRWPPSGCPTKARHGASGSRNRSIPRARRHYA